MKNNLKYADAVPATDSIEDLLSRYVEGEISWRKAARAMGIYSFEKFEQQMIHRGLMPPYPSDATDSAGSL
jgi:hypothetical protein